MAKTFIIVSLGALFCGLTYGQDTAVGPSFEVASVKVSAPGEQFSDKSDNERITLIACPLKPLIARA